MIELTNINGKRISKLKINGEEFLLPTKVINSTEQGYIKNMVDLGDKDYSYNNPICEIVKSVDKEKMQELNKRGNEYQAMITNCKLSKKGIKNKLVFLEFQIKKTDFNKLTIEDVSTLVDIAIKSEFDIIKIPDYKLSIDEFKEAFKINSNKIQNAGKKVWGYINLDEPLPRFKSKLNILKDSTVDGITFRYARINKNKSKYLYVRKHCANYKKLLHISFCENRDSSYKKYLSIQNVVSTIFDAVSLRTWKLPIIDGKFQKDISKADAKLYIEPATGFYEIKELQEEFGNKYTLSFETNFPLIGTINDPDKLLEKFSEKNELSAFVKSYSAKAISFELNKYAIAKHNSNEAEKKYFNQRNKLKEGVAIFSN